MSQELDPIKLEVAMEVAKAIDDSQNLDVSLKNLDKSVENVKKKFKQKTEELNTNTQTQKKQIQTTKTQIQAIQQQTQATQQQSEALTKNTQKFNALGNSVNQITRELPAFTYSAQTGFMAIANNIPILTDAMSKLRAENEQLKASGQRITPVWKQFIGALFSWNSLLSVGLTLLTIYGKEIGTFIASLFKGKDNIDQAKMSIEAMNKAFASDKYKKASKDILELRAEFDSAKKGIIDKNKALKDYNKIVGDVMGKVNTFADAEKKLIDQGDAYVKMMLYKAAALASLNEASKQIVENEQKKLDIENQKAKDLKELEKWKNTSSFAGAGVSSFGITYHNSKSDIQARINSHIKEIEEADKKINDLNKSSIIVYNNILGKAKEIADKFNFKLFGDEKEYDSTKIEDEYKKLLEKIGKLDKEYSKETFDKHDMEVQALKDKFAKIRTLVVEFNKKSKLKIGIDKLNTLEDKAIATLKYRHETETLKQELGKQKQLFEEYEAYKAKVGEKEAKERFKHDLNGIESYRKALEGAITKTNADTDSPQKTERLRELQAMLLLANEDQNKQDRNKFADLLEDYKGFNQKRISLEMEYNNDVALLEQQRNEANVDAVDEAIQIRKAKYEEDLSNLQASILESSDFYQKLFSDLSQKGYKTLREFAQYTTEVLKSAKTYNTTEGKTMVRIEYDQIDKQGEVVKRVSNITIAEFERIKAKAEELNKTLREKNPFAGVVSSFKEVIQNAKENKTDEIATSLVKLDQSVKMSIETFKNWGEHLSVIFGEGVGDAVDNISQLAGGVFNLGTGIARIASGDIVGGISSSLSGIASIYKQVTGWRQKAREQQVKMILADIEALRTIRQQNLALKENVRELSVYNDQLEVRNKLIKNEVIAQDGIQNKFRYDLQMLEKYKQNFETEQKIKDNLWANVTNSWFDTGKISTGSASYRQFSALIGADFEQTKRRMAETANVFGNEAREAYNMLNEAGSIENWVQMLNQRGWLHGEAKQFYEQWKKSGESVKELEKKFADLKNEMRQVVMGENFDTFVNNFANALAQAQGNVAQFAEFTHNKIKSSLFNAFKYQYLREQIKPLYEQMSDLLNQGVDTLNKDKIEALGKQFDNKFRTANAKLEQLGRRLGTNLYDNKAVEVSQNSLKGAVRGITEQQADLLAGQFGGLRLAQLETNKINKIGFSQMMKQTSKMVRTQIDIEKNTRRTADNTDVMKESLRNIETSIKSNKNDLKGNGIKP